MITSQAGWFSFSAIRTTCLFAFGLLTVSLPNLQAADSTAATQAASAPITTNFEKTADTDNGPYVLKVKNTSAQSIKVSVKILASVQSHNASKERSIDAHKISAGKTWTVSKLAAGDKVALSVPGFAPTELTVP